MTLLAITLLGLGPTAQGPLLGVRPGLSATGDARADVGTDGGDGLDERIEEALGLAGANRAEIEAFLSRYPASGDPEKHAAARWLVANMPGHGFAHIELVDGEGRVLEFEALDHASLGDAKRALDAIEASHPGCGFQRTVFESDLEHASASFLSTHLDEAFDAWRTYPWARAIPFEAFCNHILPYRGSNEPLALWRSPARGRLAALCTEIGDETDVRAVGERIRATVHPWCGFSDIFYLHPTDQGYDEMNARGKGRCEDITNMVSFGMRSVATMCASDYTPWWATRDNNHAWEVVLDRNGRGRAGLGGRAAKVYRKTFARQPSSLASIKRADEEVPRWLSSDHYIDVTAQYQPVSDTDVRIDGALDGERFAYIAVFNGGEWRPIDWAAIEEGHASFHDLGRQICYLPMRHAGGSDLAAGTPFILDADGVAHPLGARGPREITLEAEVTAPEIPDPDTGVTRARTRIKSDAGYELFVWSEGGWRSLGRREPGQSRRTFEGLRPDGLYWLVEDGSERLERPFTVDGGEQVFW